MTEQSTNEREQKAWYESYYSRKGADRNDPRLNRGAVLQLLAAEVSLIRAFRHISGPLGSTTVLDVGCGSGARFFEFFRLGLKPQNVIGMDMQQERIDAGRELLPQIELIHGDASAIALADRSLDLVFESAMFATLPDELLRKTIAREMIRVCRAGGYLLLSDWRTPKYRDKTYRALTQQDVRRLFKVGEETELLGTEVGALIPPIGRFLSFYSSWLYFPVAAILPFLVGQVVYILRKKQ